MSQPNLAHTMYFRWLDQQRQEKAAQQGLEAQQAQQLGNTIRSDEEGRQAAQKAAEGKKQLASAVQAFQGGDESPLLQSNPELGLKFQKERTDEGMNQARIGDIQARQEVAQSKVAVEKAARTARAKRALELSSPQLRPVLMKQFQGMAANNLMDMPDMSGTGAAEQEVFDPTKPTGDMVEYDAALRQGFKGTLEQWLRARANDRAAKNTTNVNLPGGGMGLRPPVAADQQKQVLASRKIAKQLDLFENILKTGGTEEEFGTFRDKIQTPLQSIQIAAADMLPPPLQAGKAALARSSNRTQADAALSKITNIDIHDLGGANVTALEQERLQRSLPSVEDAPVTRRAKISAWREYLKIIDESGIDALYNGIRSNQIQLPGETTQPVRSGPPAPITGQDPNFDYNAFIHGD